MTDFLPRANVAAVDSSGRFTRETYDALRRTIAALNDADAALSERQRETLAILNALGADDVESLEALGPLLEGKQDASDVLDKLAAILGVGLVVRTAGSFRPRSMADTATITWANANGTAGNPAASLADLADSGTGTFKLLTRDAKGRLSGTANGDAADVPYDNTASGLAATQVQAAIDEIDADLDAHLADTNDPHATVVQTITDADTTHAPSGDAVFDALALKYDVAGGNVTGDVKVGTTANSFTGTARTVSVSAGQTGDATGGMNIEGSRSSSGQLFARFGFWHQGTLVASFNSIRGAADEGSFAIATKPTGAGGFNFRWEVSSAGHFLPWADNTYDHGSASKRSREIFCANATINTSDARDKRVRGPLNKAEIAAAREIKAAVVMYQWNDAIAEKGEDARLHCSPTVQSVIAILEKHGLDPFRYGFVCYDKWDETPEAKDPETGEVTQEYRPAGDRYSLRPTELLFFIMAAL